tara:strand:- start:65 stop:817 length:753 start_codon:yes stop_codon:yes gene_type:complete
MKFVIPSLSRYNIINNKTLKLLSDYNISKKVIYVFVIQEEFELYRAEIDKDINIVIGVKGISEQRAFISNYFNEGEKLVSLDDDITKILKLQGKILLKLDSLKDLCEEAFMKLNGRGVAGVYPTKNPYYMSDTISSDLKFCIGQMRMFYNTQAIENSRNYTLLEDYETSLKYWLDKKIIRFNNIALEADFNKLAGGLMSICNRDFYTKQLEVDRFYEQYKPYCYISDRLTKKGRKIDIKFKCKLYRRKSI